MFRFQHWLGPSQQNADFAGQLVSNRALKFQAIREHEETCDATRKPRCDEVSRTKHLTRTLIEKSHPIAPKVSCYQLRRKELKLKRKLALRVGLEPTDLCKNSIMNLKREYFKAPRSTE